MHILKNIYVLLSCIFPLPNITLLNDNGSLFLFELIIDLMYEKDLSMCLINQIHFINNLVHASSLRASNYPRL